MVEVVKKLVHKGDERLSHFIGTHQTKLKCTTMPFDTVSSNSNGDRQVLLTDTNVVGYAPTNM